MTVSDETDTTKSNASAASSQSYSQTSNGKSSKPSTKPATGAVTMGVEVPEVDDFGLPIKKYANPETAVQSRVTDTKTQYAPSQATTASGVSESKNRDREEQVVVGGPGKPTLEVKGDGASKQRAEPDVAAESDSDGEEFKDAISDPAEHAPPAGASDDEPRTPVPTRSQGEAVPHTPTTADTETRPANPTSDGPETAVEDGTTEAKGDTKTETENAPPPAAVEDKAISEATKQQPVVQHSRDTSMASVNGVSEFSHQQLTAHQEEKGPDQDSEWQVMPAYAPYDIYDDDNKLIAKEHDEAEDETYGYAGLGGAGKGYTRVLLDDDAESATSMDENTQYLFKDVQGTSLTEDEEHQRDAVSQMQATKDLLTEGQRIAYVGLTRLELSAMLKEAEGIQYTRKTKKEIQVSTESMKMWSQKMMIRLYSHMDISPAEQVMIEQLSAHGVMPRDLTGLLMANARVKNPMAESDARSSLSGEKSPRPSSVHRFDDERAADPPPAYEAHQGEELPAVRTPSQLPTTEKIDIDLRWTVLCDLFLVLIADSTYDSRSRVLLEKVGSDLEISWLDICRFEKKVTDALEMQQNAEKENWNEEEHMENRRKLALRRRYVMMGLATVGGGLVIGLSAGLLAPMIGAGLAAGFTTIGVTGTSGFLAGAGGAAVITSGAAASGGIIGIKAANRRTGAVKTFEYRPLHNNKRVNLIVTVSGWMTGKVDDVRLPYSTVDPIMGDIYSVLWEPEMLTSMGDTINILATEALTQGLQQLLGSTILMGLMAALQLPIVLTKLAYLIDNPWAVSLDRATAAGLILADSLVDRNLGTRPVTLVGYSLGSRVIFSCLQELARKGAYGLIQNVVLFGSPVVVRQDEYLRARTVVSGRFINGYNRNDWILGYLFRLTNGGIRRVAGLAAVEGVQQLENMDLTEDVAGHMDYRTAMPRLLRTKCGWLVESDEFTEIEDPDPDDHQKRQRELINEIEEARKELEKEGTKGNGKGSIAGFFSRKKKALRRQEWEIYEGEQQQSQQQQLGQDSKTEDKDGNNHGVLFDIDAIRAELAKEQQQSQEAGDDLAFEQLQIRELQSTLPPMKLDLSPQPSPGPVSSPSFSNPSLAPPPVAPVRSPRDPMRESQSDVLPLPQPHSGRSSLSISSRSYRQSDERARTPTLPVMSSSHSRKASVNDAFYGQHESGAGGQEEGAIHMTFDTAFHDDGHQPRPAVPPKDVAYGLSNGSHGGSGPLASSGTEIGAGRPEMIRSAQTVPNIRLSDPWANGDDLDDDEDFGKEREIEMTFA